MAAFFRVWLLGLMAVGVWVLAAHGPTTRPVAQGREAPAGQFSAARAQATLTRLLGPQKPHPAGSEENAALHTRLLQELTQLGAGSQTQTGMSCFAARRGGVIQCATVGNIIAQVLPGDGKAILLMAHLDSVAAGPGAGDDASGVATILETIRALKADAGAARHPVIALFTDGEELGLLGANLFLRDAAWRNRVGLVINAEARGNQGPSYLFQTSPGDSKLVDLYARNTAHPATSSLYGEIYKYLPNDTDFTPFLRAGIAGYNFAFIGNAAQYHTALDRIENLDPRTLQHHGDNILGLTRGLLSADIAALKGGNAIYFDVLGRWLPRLPQSWALPLALLIFFAIALAGWLSPRPRLHRPLLSFLMPPLLLAGCIGAGFGLHSLAALVSGNADPSFAHPLALRVALGFGVWTMALLTMRRAGAIASWLWLAGLGITAAVFAPGISPYFLFPCLIAAPLLLLTLKSGRAPALFLAALCAMLAWIGLAAGSEAIMGLSAHFLFTVPVAMGLIAALPLLSLQKMGEGAWRLCVLASLLLAVGAAVLAGFQPAYSITQPQRLNLRYAEKDGKSFWLADPVAHLPDSLRKAARFSAAPQNFLAWRGYIAPAGMIQLPAPSASIARQDNRLTLDLHGSDAASGMSLLISGGLQAVTVGGVRTPASAGQFLWNCATPDCASAQVTLDFSGPLPKSLLLAEQRFGLPAKGASLLKARPDWSTSSQMGNVSVVATDVAIPPV